MSTNQEQIVDPNPEEDLDAFNDLFHGKTKESPKEKPDDAPPQQEEVTQEDDEDDANDLAPEDETDNDGDDEGDEDPSPPVKKSRTEKRIEKLLEEARLARERAERAERELQKREQEKQETKAPVTPPPTAEADTGEKPPHPDDKNEDGTDKYPLGQFDEAFQEDRFNYMMKKSLAEQRAALEQQAREAEAKRAQEALAASWTEKLEPIKAQYTDFEEKGEQLLATFSGLDQQYGEYLTTTIMAMDHGPEVLYYLSNNITEADRIVKLGPLGATIALGRIEAQFLADSDGKSPPRPKMSKAPPAPPRNKGSNAAVPEVPDDTDDLDLFSSKFFKRG